MCEHFELYVGINIYTCIQIIDKSNYNALLFTKYYFDSNYMI